MPSPARIRQADPRTTCLIPGCKRTTGKPHEEWICGKHWSQVPRDSRRALSSIVRAYRRRFGDQGFWVFPPGSDDRIAAAKMDLEWRAAWAAIKEAAVAEHFMGVI